MDRRTVLAGLAVSMVLAVFLSPFASPRPDGLERVAEDKGFLHRGEGEPALAAPVPDYAMPGVGREGLATAAAGALGTLLTFAAAAGVAAIAKRRP
ncbi:MAG: PDGLE domain-containing protein [bacterium]|nr:PDGLE domain-containing protein [bacterium]